jgi:hypothetical protein
MEITGCHLPCHFSCHLLKAFIYKGYKVISDKVTRYIGVAHTHESSCFKKTYIFGWSLADLKRLSPRHPSPKIAGANHG